MESISLRELKGKIDQGQSFMLIEALPPYEYQRGHLPGAINIPANQIGEISASALPDKTAEIVVYCANLQCHASEIAAQELDHQGYTKVQVFRDGKQGWLDAGFELDYSGVEIPLTVDPD